MSESYLPGRHRAKSVSGRCEVFARLGDDPGANRLEGPGNQCAGGLRMPTSAESLREVIDVQGASAAKRHLHLPVAEIAKEDRHPRARDGPRMLGDSVELLRPQRVLLHYAGRQRDPRQTDGLVDLERV